MASGIACTAMCKLQPCTDQKQQEAEDDSVEVGDPDDDVDWQVDVSRLCLIIVFEPSYTVLHTRACSRPAYNHSDS